MGKAMEGGLFAQALPLRTFVEKRTASVAAQLAGASKGYVPTMNFSHGGPKGGAQLVETLGGPFLIFRTKVQDELRLTQEQKEKLAGTLPGHAEATMKAFEKLKDANPIEREKKMQEHRQKSAEKLTASP